MSVLLLIPILGTSGTIYFTYADYKAQKTVKEHFNKIAVIGHVFSRVFKKNQGFSFILLTHCIRAIIFDKAVNLVLQSFFTRFTKMYGHMIGSLSNLFVKWLL